MDIKGGYDLSISDLIVNNVYSNNDITDAFKCSPQGGMRRSKRTNTLVLVSNHTGSSIYGDKWIAGEIHYTGMGQEGDQSLGYSQNRTLAESDSNGIQVYLFEVFNDREYTYAGKVELAGEPYEEIEQDREGNDRIVYRFPLRTVDGDYLPTEEIIETTDQNKERQAKRKTQDEVEEIAKRKSASNQNESQYRTVTTKAFERDPYIREHVKNLADGTCQLCEQDAPFEVGGEPFLHVHHIEFLADGGDDTIENSIALCPNCHAKVHMIDQDHYKDILKQKVVERNV